MFSIGFIAGLLARICNKENRKDIESWARVKRAKIGNVYSEHGENEQVLAGEQLYRAGALRMTTYETEIIIFDDCNEYMRLVGLFWCFAGVAQWQSN